MRKYIDTLMKLCFSAVILGEATVILLLDGYSGGWIDMSISVFPELFTAVLAAAAITSVGVLLLYRI